MRSPCRARWRVIDLAIATAAALDIAAREEHVSIAAEARGLRVITGSRPDGDGAAAEAEAAPPREKVSNG